jgi:hypothetical protein
MEEMDDASNLWSGGSPRVVNTRRETTIGGMDGKANFNPVDPPQGTAIVSSD